VVDLCGPLFWLRPVKPTLVSVERIAALSRLTPVRIAALQPLRSWDSSTYNLAYCDRCVFLNHAEVESPYWHAAWLDPRTETCATEERPLRQLGASQFRRYANMPSMIRTVGRIEAKRGRWQ